MYRVLITHTQGIIAIILAPCTRFYTLRSARHIGFEAIRFVGTTTVTIYTAFTFNTDFIIHYH